MFIIKYRILLCDMIENFLVRNSLHISRELGGVDGDPSLCHNKLSKHQVVEVHKLYDFVDTYIWYC